MTPAQLDSLGRSHRRVHDPKQRSVQPETGNHADLMAFAAMRRV